MRVSMCGMRKALVVVVMACTTMILAILHRRRRNPICGPLLRGRDAQKLMPTWRNG